MPQALRVADVLLQITRREVLGRVVRQVQVRAELRVAGAIEAVAGQAVLLELGEAILHLLGRVHGRQQRRETLGQRLQVTDAGDLEWPLLRADAGGLGIGPDQIERPGGRFAGGQGRPGVAWLLDGQPGPRAVLFQQRGGRQLGGKSVERHGLQVVAGFHPIQQSSQRYRTVMHGAVVGDVGGNLDVLRPGVRQ